MGRVTRVPLALVWQFDVALRLGSLEPPHRAAGDGAAGTFTARFPFVASITHVHIASLANTRPISSTVAHGKFYPAIHCT